MTPEQLSDVLRVQFGNIMRDNGFTSYAISKLTLGRSRVDVFNRFMDGRILGHKPLRTIFNGLDCNLHIVPVLPKSKEIVRLLDSATMDSVNLLCHCILNYLLNEEADKLEKRARELAE